MTIDIILIRIRHYLNISASISWFRKFNNKCRPYLNNDPLQQTGPHINIIAKCVLYMYIVIMLKMKKLL